ncbi:MAG TPA: Smr/MutS family protein [Acidobacteriota bacterium]|jgi:DNA-nicking Smr family endonuclease|nr:Smr/MutS family protein [Acidobacteriota bacterium]HNT16856.1 Smr/MutS family protein [Acidobacteriota bacterium]HPA26159.1 Smr/MutS family protein [Acidobacteriota bacterium]HQO19623.1 Smr/MutS family protein [Acidobacteriota bacterium]HQQ46202.1 Smr/MutS family protein [Acidobacteriota bacterium]
MTETPVTIPIEGVLDLHTFDPKEVKDLIPEYLRLCREKGMTEVRIIHGKGSGSLKATVLALVARIPFVAETRDAGPAEGGWGATIVCLRQRCGNP